MSEERLQRIEERLDGIESRVTDLGVSLRAEMADMRDTLRAETHNMGMDILMQMRVLHEDVIDRIKAIPDTQAYIDRRIDDGLGVIRKEFEPRIEVLEAAEKKRGSKD